MNISQSSPNFAPVFNSLQQIAQRLEQGELRILIASESLQEFKRQELAAHNTITTHQICGKRVSVRGRRHADQPRKVLARWPEDHLLEPAHSAIFFILQGQAGMRAANYSIHCRPGDAIYYPVGVPRADGSIPDSVKISPDAFCDTLLFSPGEAFGYGLECSISHLRGGQTINGSINKGCWLRNIQIARLYTELSDELSARGDTNIARRFLSLIFALFQREIKEGNALAGWQHPVISVHVAQPTLIQSAIEHVQTNLATRLFIDDVAQHVGMSRTAFTVEFRREMGQSFREYLIDQRLEYAKLLLLDANLSINRISELAGLSPRRLRGLFHKKYQQSPDQYRTLQNKPSVTD